MIYGDDNIHAALEKIAAIDDLQKIKTHGGTPEFRKNVRRHNRFVRSGGKRGNIIPVSPSTYTMKTSSVYADDNIHKALEKVALFG